MSDVVSDWVALVDGAWPESTAASWDRVGLQVGDPTWAVARVLLTLDVTPSVIEEAATVPGTLVLAHHPLLFRPLERLTPDTASGRTALLAATQRVAVAAAHTNLDVAVDGAGTSSPVARLLGLADTRSLTDPVDGAGFGIIGSLPTPMPLRALAAAIRDGLPAPHLRTAGQPDRLVRVVAVVGGAGDGHLDDARHAGADVYVTGDLRHHVTLDAVTMGLAVIDAGHHATEVAALPHWRQRLTELATAWGLSAPVIASSVDTSPWTR